MKNAFTNRNVLCGGLIYAFMGFIQVAVAGFAQLSPPPEISQTNNQFSFRASNQSPFIDGSARMNATLNVGAQRIQVPVYARVAANAPLFAARYIFRHPLVTAAGAAAFLAPIGIQWLNGQWVTEQPHTYPVSTGYGYLGNNDQIFTDSIQACISTGIRITRRTDITCILRAVNPDHSRLYRIRTLAGQDQLDITVLRRVNPSCPAGWFITPAGCVQTPQPITRPLTEEEFVPLVAPQIQPAQVPNIVPNTVPIPVETPTINPAPRTVPDPYTPPIPRPLIVPLSDPVPIPNTQPQQWRQPLVQINPSPTPDNAWRVSLNPKERITTSPHGITDPVSDLDPATPVQPSPDSDFCIRNPEVLACARVPEFDIPNDEIQTLTEVISYEPEQFLGGGSCPSPVTVNLGGSTITAFDTPRYCQFISTYFRPVLLAIAAFTALMIVAGGFRSV